ncbi:MAG: SLATT domain-containing protein [Rhodospirillales bacterium]|nr:SLATT domain-containing protein [Rhodospirillales bacterium]
MIDQSDKKILEAQLRECFGRVIYTHKTHSKMADRCAATLTRVKITQIVLSALTASGTVGLVFTNAFTLKIATALISLLTVAISSYMKGFDPGATAQKHRDAAADMWPIRESYLSLLSDLAAGDTDLAQVRERRDDLQEKLAAIYRGAPHTTGAAYVEAQEALQKNEEYTFSDEEIDKFLPADLRRANMSKSNP